MTTFTSKIAEIEKGCGKRLTNYRSRPQCGIIKGLCPTCQAKLQTLLEAQKMIRLVIIELQEYGSDGLKKIHYIDADKFREKLGI